MSTETPQDRSNELLTQVNAEMRNSIGFNNDGELQEERERALLYRKGNMLKDVPSLPNRSKAVSSDINDAIQSALPDLMEIFIGGDDVVAFLPQKPDDEEPAEQETAYLKHVVFQDNPGFLNFYTAIDDALTLKTGIWHFDWEPDIQECEEEFTGKNIYEIAQMSQEGEIEGLKADDDTDYSGDNHPGMTPDTTFSFTLKSTKDRSSAKYWPVAPDDFAVGMDTKVNLAEANYTCMRSRPRAQDLIAKGYDPEKVRNLPTYTDDDNEQIQQARDTAGERTVNPTGSDDMLGDLRQVEIRKHHLRKLGSDNKLEIWAIVTDSEATVELAREKVQRIPYAAITPYITSHRFYGRSLADLLFDIQRIKTALYRMILDSGYFALNQRSEISMTSANDYTISDFLRNEPGVPVRSKDGNAVKPIQAGALNFDAFQATEFFSSVAEMRTGVVRNAQGLAADSLHDTSSGMMTLLSAAQKRIKMIARVFAETGIKDLYLGLHAIIRENTSSEQYKYLLGKWTPVNPSNWAERNAMTVSVGLGASGKDMDIAAMNNVIALQKAGVELQGGAQGPIVTLENLYNAANTLSKKLGVQAPALYFSDPDSPEMQQKMAQQAQAAASKPDPETAKVQGELQLKQTQIAGDQQLAQTKAQNEKDIAVAKAQATAATDTHRNQLEHEREVQNAQDRMALAQLEIASKERIAIRVAAINAQAKIGSAQVAAGVDDGEEEIALDDSLATSA